MAPRTALTTNGREEFKALIQISSTSQSCQAHSTPEAEMVAMDVAVRKMGIPSLNLWNTVLQRSDTDRRFTCHCPRRQFSKDKGL